MESAPIQAGASPGLPDCSLIEELLAVESQVASTSFPAQSVEAWNYSRENLITPLDVNSKIRFFIFEIKILRANHSHLVAVGRGRDRRTDRGLRIHA